MKTLQNYAVFYLTIILLIGCLGMPTPETNIERLSVLEISYGVILDKATLYANENRLSESQIQSLDTAFDNYEEARNLAQLAIEASDEGGFDNQATAINTILLALRSILAEVEE